MLSVICIVYTMIAQSLMSERIIQEQKENSLTHFCPCKLKCILFRENDPEFGHLCVVKNTVHIYLHVDTLYMCVEGREHVNITSELLTTLACHQK